MRSPQSAGCISAHHKSQSAAESQAGREYEDSIDNSISDNHSYMPDIYYLGMLLKAQFIDTVSATYDGTLGFAVLP